LTPTLQPLTQPPAASSRVLTPLSQPLTPTRRSFRHVTQSTARSHANRVRLSPSPRRRPTPSTTSTVVTPPSEPPSHPTRAFDPRIQRHGWRPPPRPGTLSTPTPKIEWGRGRRRPAPGAHPRGACATPGRHPDPNPASSVFEEQGVRLASHVFLLSRRLVFGWRPSGGTAPRGALDTRRRPRNGNPSRGFNPASSVALLVRAPSQPKPSKSHPVSDRGACCRRWPTPDRGGPV
jgi:hypothetical protein